VGLSAISDVIAPDIQVLESIAFLIRGIVFSWTIAVDD
jgi:hypothetical protein